MSAVFPVVIDFSSYNGGEPCEWFFDPFQEAHDSLLPWGPAINYSELHAHRMLSTQHLSESRW